MSKTRKANENERLRRKADPERLDGPRPSPKELRQGTYFDYAETVARDEAAFWQRQERDAA